MTAKFLEEVKSVAAVWQREIEQNREYTEKKFHAMMQRMLKNPMNKIFLIELLDQSFRSNDNNRIADQLEYLFEKHRHTDFFTEFEQLLVWLFRHLGLYIPNLSVPMFIWYLRNDVSNMVIKGESPSLAMHLDKRRKEGTRVNINIIGEAVLGEAESQERVKKYLSALQTPSIDYISIKISTIFSQISALAHDWSVEQISYRLELIYLAAMKYTFVNDAGEIQHKFVNLDMEEYRDIELTIDAFIHTLSKAPFVSLYAGIVLQAYVPDAMSHLKHLVQWARERVKKGGAPIKVRLVKGANQEMELTEASLRGWPCVTYLNKTQTDANYKILMNYLLDPDVAPYVHTGVASHNLFDHALGMLLARERGVERYYAAEMLEGMSETAYKLLKKEGLDVILYAPTATADTFTNAIAYLVRRFDENTAQQNFLRHSFGLHVGSNAWIELLKSYDDAIALLPYITLKPFRSQNRDEEFTKIDIDNYKFENESDTDFILVQNRLWAEKIRDKWKNIGANGGYHAAVVIGGVLIEHEKHIKVMDKSQYDKKVIVGTYATATAENLNEAVRVAKTDPDSWRKLDAISRQKILMNVAQEFKKARGDLIGIAGAEVGKVFTETDVEVSEAIDFLNFYPYSVRKVDDLEGISSQGKGVGLVISPWNFPIAIPTGGIAAALAAGNTVILKPSSDAVLCGYRLCQCFWDGGVSKNVLQFVPTKGSLAGKTLITNPTIDFVIFTGGESTAYDILLSRPDIRLSAETGGKDATIVTALADRDQAIKNVVASAFNNSGQKCSAASLLVLHREVYEDERFKQALIDAASSLEVGSVWEFKNRVGTLVRAPSGNLDHALKYLDSNEHWEIEPSYCDNNPYMLKPSIRWGTKMGDYCHMNELFGPVLSVMCAEDLEDAIDIVNSTGYGLTSSLESLDTREQELWKEKLLAGNLYINRGTTGAIVQRQPFGGMRKSAIGSGKKAGGFNYVAQFMKISYEEIDGNETLYHPYMERLKSLMDVGRVFTADMEKAIYTASKFAFWLDHEFVKEHDYCNIRGESNVIRYLNVKSVLLRFEMNDTLHDMLVSIAAVKMAGARLIVSMPTIPQSEALLWLSQKITLLLDEEDKFLKEEENDLLATMGQVERIRFLHPDNITPQIYQSISAQALYIACEPFIEHGRIELMHYFIEQSISHSYHRYGNLGIYGLKEKEN